MPVFCCRKVFKNENGSGRIFFPPVSESQRECNLHELGKYRQITESWFQGDYDVRGQQTAFPMLTAIMSGGVGISGRELSTQLINSLEQANHSFS